jgi:hypothetical protein
VIADPVRDATPSPNNVLRYEGKLYEFYSVKSITPAGAVINHSKGTLVIPLEKLPPTISTPHKKQVQEAFAGLRIANQKAAEKKEAEEKARQGKEEREIWERARLQSIRERQSEENAKVQAEARARQIEKQARDAELRAKQEKYPGYSLFHINIVQVLPSGVMADQMTYVGTNTPIRSGKIIFVEGAFPGAYENQRLWVGGYPDDVFRYQDTQGAQRTIQRWVVVPE